MTGDLRNRRDDRGSSAVEIAVLMPVMMLLLMAVVQVGLWFHVRAVMQTAANRGVDAARVEDGSLRDGYDAAAGFLDHTGALHDQTVDIDQREDTVSVSISGRVVSLVFGAPLPISVNAEAPIERLTP